MNREMDGPVLDFFLIYYFLCRLPLLTLLINTNYLFVNVYSTSGGGMGLLMDICGGI